MRRSNCAGALQYVSELTWILFLRILDEQEPKDAERAEAVGAELMCLGGERFCPATSAAMFIICHAMYMPCYTAS